MHISFTIPWWVIAVVCLSLGWWGIGYYVFNPVLDYFIQKHHILRKAPGYSTVYRKEIFVRCLLDGPVGLIIFILYRGNP